MAFTMPDHEDSLGGEILDGDAKADSAEQSLGDGATMGGDTAAHSLGDQSTFGDANVYDELFEDEMEVVNLRTRYTEEGVLGKGGFGEVVLATDTRLGRKVAIKRIQGKAARNKKAVGLIVATSSMYSIPDNQSTATYPTILIQRSSEPFTFICFQGNAISAQMGL
jgi:hypothetical protein